MRKSQNWVRPRQGVEVGRYFSCKEHSLRHFYRYFENNVDNDFILLASFSELS